MPRTVTVVIREDPRQSHRAVEALRIALGLGAGEDRLAVLLLDYAPLLLAEDRDEIVDEHVLEKYLPSFQHLETEFLVPPGTTARLQLEQGLTIHELPLPDLQRRVVESDRVLVF